MELAAFHREEEARKMIAQRVIWETRVLFLGKHPMGHGEYFLIGTALLVILAIAIGIALVI